MFSSLMSDAYFGERTAREQLVSATRYLNLTAESEANFLGLISIESKAIFL